MANHDPSGPEHVPLPAAAPRPRSAPAHAHHAPHAPRGARSDAAAQAAAQVAAVVAVVAAVGAGLWLARGSRSEDALAAARAIMAPASIGASALAPAAAPELSGPSRPAPPPALSAPPRLASPSSAGGPVLTGETAPIAPPVSSLLPAAPSAPRDSAPAAPVAAVKALPEPPTAEMPEGVPDAVALAALVSQPRRLSAAATSALFNRSVGGFVPWNDPARSRSMQAGFAGESGGGAPMANAWAGTGTCSDCADAIDRTGHAAYRPGHGGGTLGYWSFVGSCGDGFVYRLTNNGRVPLPPYLVGDDGEVWKIGAVSPGQSVDIRSQKALRAAAYSRSGH